MAKIFIVSSVIALLALPLLLLFKRRMNASLFIFYVLLGLYTIVDLTGASRLSIQTIIAGVCMFAIASGLEYIFRRDYFLAGVSVVVLLLFALSWYVAGELGAFA
jgi:hypothetical protein